ncbi:hypothetical protein P4C99_03560 [Pontiellaceae bacterium B1224]|nr:hypothetical protein [Pontiellaceae bacterium B1224]
MADELKPIKDAPEQIRNIITKVIDHEKRNINVRRGIKDDVIDIIKKEIQ